jgi:hypothetical protein
MSLNLSGETTAIATAVLAAFAIVTAVFAFLAFLSSPGKSARLSGRLPISRNLADSRPRSSRSRPT